MNSIATIHAAVDDLAVGYRSYDHDDAGNVALFFPSANTPGEGRRTYIAVDGRGIFDPVTPSD